jgi:N-acetylglucosamine-6-phosphate deacetylase
MASENPARLMGLNKGKVEAGLDADLVFTDGEYNLVGVMKGGEIYE